MDLGNDSFGLQISSPSSERMVFVLFFLKRCFINILLNECTIAIVVWILADNFDKDLCVSVE